MQQQIPFPATTARPINAQTGTSYTFTLRDMYRLVTFDNASPVTATVPAHDDVLFPVGAQLDVLQVGDGKVTFTASGAATINSRDGNLSIAAKSVGVSLIQRSENVWELIGDLVA